MPRNLLLFPVGVLSFFVSIICGPTTNLNTDKTFHCPVYAMGLLRWLLDNSPVYKESRGAWNFIERIHSGIKCCQSKSDITSCTISDSTR